MFFHKTLSLLVNSLHLREVIAEGDSGDYWFIIEVLVFADDEPIEILIKVVFDLIFVLILPYLGNPLLYLFGNFILQEFFVFKLDALISRIIFMDKQRNFLDEYAELVLLHLAVLKDAIQFVLILPAVKEKDDGNDSDCNKKIVDHINHLSILGSVFVVAR